MKLRDKIILAIIGIIALGWLIYRVGAVLAPFVFALIVAYLFNPLVSKITRKFNTSRTVVTSIILLLLTAIVVISILVLAPIIANQLSQVIEALAHNFKEIPNNIYSKISVLLERFGIAKDKFDFMLKESSFNNSNSLLSGLMNISQNLWNATLESSGTIISIVSFIFITPVLVFYLLRDFEIMKDKIKRYLPKAYAKTILRITRQIDITIAGYLRGQLNVCLIMAIIYSSFLTIAQLNFGLLVGVITGLLTFIPYVGVSIGVVIGVTLALFQWGLDWSHLGMVAIAFGAGQIIESNFLTPRLIGAKIGLHPVWIIFGLFFFGALFGFVGVLLAIPMTATIGVIVKHFAVKYATKRA